ncbi:hypothetical protein PF004_g23148 [Phytophthora fragariae]|uniref:Uncharacterized protein n=1 Tax=Phytophthora fragariae TaxID=53985 RepID=A0A6G0QG17_9STRA|nr:hypothetical protein PF004_g23148 [Phytophthora fragariae]KAE9285697.1 hypothetical protein PF008_g26853 [Phytophthora fragariae]
MRAAALTINLLSLSSPPPQVLAAGHTDQVRLLISCLEAFCSPTATAIPVI